MIEVRLDAWLKEFGPRGPVSVEAATLGELFDDLERQHPRLRFKLRDETGQLRRFVKVFVDGSEVPATEMAATSLASAHTVDILHSIAGG